MGRRAVYDVGSEEPAGQLDMDQIVANVQEKAAASPHPQSPSELQSPLAGAAPHQPIIEENYSRSLNDAAATLINILTPTIRDYAIELANMTLHIPLWQLVLGAFIAQYEAGNLTAPSIDPAWKQVEELLQDSTCQWPECKQKFTPKRFGQKFCSTACGDKQRALDVTERNRRREAELAAERRGAGLLR